LTVQVHLITVCKMTIETKEYLHSLIEDRL
jgi:hypothetical protein